ncbi:dUTP pyrophosphatase [Clostridium acetobutylicum]|uniref:dUTP diphosphatase n=1 Tax=Clostridium acetobutylicum (strain ATCC 824 / DSM 792 / JCM 1419 / IAM 19013 / LMG 5710 / NBRC 13948 / NRRL B-527 / VKM B-1787 / 2291 / W) TaxID=272562 RepID=Q97JR3_CLOAB|nr:MULTISPECIES: dUTP diphosphatase [Clostridium]AAK79182.1 Deoxyuridine 5'triphosphate nucleotidohydrolase (DUPTase) [Clostridium acetobutylicum ATCC 824]ADZ20260.1 Deoxyuridine 5'triphosphate nucleotidohydrolase (DUPTase) [Clostridium acetobutylicum EA 2018]AEI34633.1 deoxyuridine 5'-triphosphate nucleotidohydrolase [Clostridium acetobutylicum DSM 1731]AWV81567.1 dUTP diphosphatase [Clostridium acetobutylicum]MBC2393207.1 dUTP diphosphatase [Clostridium acetobutylicum]
MKKIKCKVDFEDMRFLPQYKTEGSVGLDLRAWRYILPKSKEMHKFSGDFYLNPHKRILIKTGVHIELPPNIEAQLRPRSGLALEHGITAILGTIDNDYRGDIGIILLNTSNEPFVIHEGDRLGQLVFAKFRRYKLNIIDNLSNTKRANKGFGSTGIE